MTLESPQKNMGKQLEDKATKLKKNPAITAGSLCLISSTYLTPAAAPPSLRELNGQAPNREDVRENIPQLVLGQKRQRPEPTGPIGN